MAQGQTLKPGQDVTALMSGQDVTDLMTGSTPPPAPAKPVPHPHAQVGQMVLDALGGIWGKTAEPLIEMAGGLASSAGQLLTQPAGASLAQLKDAPRELVSGIAQAQVQPLQHARDAWAKGDRVSAVSSFLNFMIPLLGPQLEDINQRTSRGELSPAGMVGESLGVGLQAAGPAATSRLTRIRVPSPAANRNPVLADAVRFGQREGIPVDAATATGNPAIAGIQHVSDRTLGGVWPGQRAAARQQAALAETGDRLATRAHPTPQTAELASDAVTGAVRDRVTQYQQTANQAYDALRKMEADPKYAQQVQIGTETKVVKRGKGHPPLVQQVPTMGPMGLPVDLRAAKAALKPVFERMTRQLPVTQQRASPALKAMENILDGPNVAPLSQVDADLSAIKALSRGADLPELRDVSQGIAAEAVKQIDAAVMAAAKKAGPDVVKALQVGRKAVVDKYHTADVLASIEGRTGEPVGAFRRMVTAGDAGIDRLRETARLAPQDVQKLGRAVLDDLLGTAKAEGGFQHGAKLYSEWQRLGPETKKVLFPDVGHVKDLDRFFLLAKQMAKNPNPSGTATVIGSTVSASGLLLFLTEPISALTMTLSPAAVSTLLHSPRFAKLLADGLTIPLRNRAKAVAVAGPLLSAAKEAGATAPGLVPALSDQERPGGPPR